MSAVSAATAAPARAAWVEVLRAPWSQRRNQGSMWLVYLLLAVGLIACGVVMITWAELQASVLVASVIATLAAALWIWLVASVQQQNEPHIARLVPGHVRTLRRVLAGAALAILALASLIGAWFGAPLIAAAGTAFGLLAVAWIVRMPQLGFLGWLIPATQTRWSRAPFVAEAGAALAQAWRADPRAAGALLLLSLGALGAVSLKALVREGDARHQRRYRAGAKRRAAVGAGRSEHAAWVRSGRVGEWFGGIAQAFYRQRLASVSAQRSGNVLARSLVGLGPSFHWSGQIGAALVYGGLGALVLALVWNGGAGTTGLTVAWPLSVGALSFAVSSGLGARMALHHTRREQALLMLLPGMPHGVALNRRLGWTLLAQFIAGWALATVVCVALVLPEGASSRWLLTLSPASLPVAALLWRDWSCLRAPTPITAMTPVLLSAFSACIAFGLAAWLGLNRLQLGAGFAVLTVALLVWRHRTFQAPTAFPAGRLAR